MKRIAATLALLCIMLSLPTAYAGTPKHPTGTHPRTYSTARHSSASRPYYGGGKLGGGEKSPTFKKLEEFFANLRW